MSKYITSIFILIFSFSALSQTQNKDAENTKTAKDSLHYHPKTYGLRFGIDILKPILAITEDLKGVEFVTDWRINTKLFIASEFGYIHRTLPENTFNHTVNGSYVKAGINYNLFNNWLNMDNEIYVGLRYGFASFQNTLNNYTIFQEGTYFDIKEVDTPIEFDALNAHWIEAVAGLKVEMIPNVYMGFMININRLITTNNPNNFENTYSPGFGKISDNGTGFNINYTLSYRIPMYKK